MAHLVILKDDVSRHFAELGYQLIHEIENLLRRLIAYFMYTKVGMDWESIAMPPSVQQLVQAARERDGKSSSIEYQPSALELTDFDILTDYLLRPYPDKAVDQLHKVLSHPGGENGLIDATKLEAFVPRSNWERYFSKIVDIDENKLRQSWRELYKLRNKVAHNRLVTKGDYQHIVRLTQIVREPLQQAYDNMGNVEVPIEERKAIESSVADIPSRSYFSSYEKLEKERRQQHDISRAKAQLQSVVISRKIRKWAGLAENHSYEEFMRASDAFRNSGLDMWDDNDREAYAILLKENNLPLDLEDLAWLPETE